MTAPGPIRARFNHAAVSVARDLLQEPARRELCDFFGDVFGMEEMPTELSEGQTLILRAADFEQFLFVHGSDDPMTCGDTEHIGLSVSSMAEIDEMYRRARARAGSDSRVTVTERELSDFGPVQLHSFYVRFVLPIRFEIQHYEVDPGIADIFYCRGEGA